MLKATILVVGCWLGFFCVYVGVLVVFVLFCFCVVCLRGLFWLVGFALLFFCFFVCFEAQECE